jgi:transposase
MNAANCCDILKDKLEPVIRTKRYGRLSKGAIIVHDKARPHSAQAAGDVLDELGWEVLPHPPYSPDLSPCDCHLFGTLKEHLGSHWFNTNKDVIETVLLGGAVSQKFFAAGIRELPERWTKCIAKQEQYTEI